MDLIEEIRSHALLLNLVGSRETCNPPPQDTDQDVLVLIQPGVSPVIGRLFEHGFEVDGSRIEDAASHLRSDGTFQSFSKGDLNFIVTCDPTFYARFMAATSVAKRLNLLDKADRIALFQAVLYGNPDTSQYPPEPTAYDEIDELFR